MNKFLAGFMVALVLALGSRSVQAADAVETRALTEAQQAAQEWLALVDGGDSAQAWEKAAPDLKKHVSKRKWQAALREMRNPLGKLASRKASSATYTKELAGAPEGEYVVIRFETAFEKRPAATETVTTFLGNDLRWRVSGYTVK